MTRKDYRILAEALKMAMPHKGETVGLRQWWFDVKAVSEALAKDNRNFRQETFLDACGREAAVMLSEMGRK